MGSSPNLADNCLSISKGSPIIFHAIPIATMTTSNSEICQGDSVIIELQFSGLLPIQYQINNDSFETNESSATLEFYPETDTSFQLVTVIDNSFCINDNSFVINVHVVEYIEIYIVDSICSNESIVVNGIRYDIENPNGVQIYQEAGNECKTRANIDLSFYPSAESHVDQSLCLGETYEFLGQLISHSIDTMIIMEGLGSNGCDSLIYLSLEIKNEIGGEPCIPQITTVITPYEKDNMNDVLDP